MMAKGSSIHFGEALKMATLQDLDVGPFLKLFGPLKKWLIKEIDEKNITVGWN